MDQGQESSEESDDSDNEHGRRRRFKTERPVSIKLSTHKAADIPDTLGQCVLNQWKKSKANIDCNEFTLLVYCTDCFTWTACIEIQH